MAIRWLVSGRPLDGLVWDRLALGNRIEATDRRRTFFLSDKAADGD
jgi:hypothetical protein